MKYHETLTKDRIRLDKTRVFNSSRSQAVRGFERSARTKLVQLQQGKILSLTNFQMA
jgi:hypothetical protein